MRIATSLRRGRTLLALGAFSIAPLRATGSHARAEQLAVEKQLLLEQSRDEAATDALTGLGNRRKLLVDAEYGRRGSKSAIPEAILDKPGPLDDDEWQFMRRHTVIGERCAGAQFDPQVVEAFAAVLERERSAAA